MANKAPPRIQRLLIPQQKYLLTVTYVPGKFLFIADTLSRVYLADEGNQQELNEDIEVMIHCMVAHYHHLLQKSLSFKKETAKNEALQQLKEQMVQGWPDH